jgi:hypothetical protein
MDYDEAAKSLKDIKATMGRSSTRMAREPGWFFVIAGAMWFVGYLVTQFAPAAAGPVWLVVTVLGCGAMAALGVFLRKKKGGARHPGLPSRITAIAIGIVAFAFLLALSFGLDLGRSLPALLMLSTAFAYFILGMTVQPVMGLMGVLLGLSVAASMLFWPAWLYLSIAVLGGGTFIASGLFIVFRKAKGDD